MADKLFTLHIVILNHPAALPDAAEQPLVTGRNGSKGAHRTKVTGVISHASQPQNWASAQVVAHANFVGWCFVDRRGPRIVGARASAYI